MSNQILLLASKYLSSNKFSFLSSVRFPSSQILDFQKNPLDFEMLKFLCYFPSDAIQFLRGLEILKINKQILDFILNDSMFRKSLSGLRKFRILHDPLIKFEDYEKIIGFLPKDCNIYLNCPMAIDFPNIREIGCYDFNDVKRYKNLETLNLINNLAISTPSFHLCKFLDLKHLSIEVLGPIRFTDCHLKPSISKLESISAPELELNSKRGNIQTPYFKKLSLSRRGSSLDINFFKPSKCDFGKFKHDGYSIHDSVIFLKIKDEMWNNDPLRYCKFFPNLYSLSVEGNNEHFEFPVKLLELYITSSNHRSFFNKNFDQLDKISVVIDGQFDDFEKITNVRLIRLTGRGKIKIEKCGCEKLFYKQGIEIEKTPGCTTELIEI